MVSALKAALPIAKASLTRRTKKEMFSDEIESLISSGILRAGDELPGERDLAELLGVSRETVRGGLKRLAENGRVTISHGARTYVSDVKPDKPSIGLSNFSSLNGYGIDDVFRVRIDVERLVVANAAMNIDDELIARLERTMEAQQASFGELAKFFICDRTFHFLIYSACDNKLLSDLATDLFVYMLDQRRGIADSAAVKRGFSDHIAIMEALKQRDAQRAAEAAAFHVDRQYKTTLRLVAPTLGAPA